MPKPKREKSFKRATEKIDKLIKGAETVRLSGNPDTLEAETRLQVAAAKVKKEGITNERD